MAAKKEEDANKLVKEQLEYDDKLPFHEPKVCDRITEILINRPGPSLRTHEDCKFLAKILKKYPTFEKLEYRFLLELGKHATLLRGSQGAVIGSEGDISDFFLIMLKGSASLWVKKEVAGKKIAANFIRYMAKVTSQHSISTNFMSHNFFF